MPSRGGGGANGFAHLVPVAAGGGAWRLCPAAREARGPPHPGGRRGLRALSVPSWGAVFCHGARRRLLVGGATPGRFGGVKTRAHATLPSWARGVMWIAERARQSLCGAATGLGAGPPFAGSQKGRVPGRPWPAPDMQEPRAWPGSLHRSSSPSSPLPCRCWPSWPWPTGRGSGTTTTPASPARSASLRGGAAVRATGWRGLSCLAPRVRRGYPGWGPSAA